MESYFVNTYFWAQKRVFFDIKIYLKPMTQFDKCWSTNVAALVQQNAEYHATLNVEMGYEMNTVEHFVVRQMLIVSYWL